MRSMSTSERTPHNGIQYVGLPGVTHDCEQAVVRLIQCGENIERARILSNSNEHCLLLTVGVGDLIAVKSGFTSGYEGTGPHAFSYVLQLFDLHGVKIEEYDVGPELLASVDDAALSISDIDDLDARRPVRPSRWSDYVLEAHWERARNGTLWRDFPPIIPFAIIDPRLADLAMSFWAGPDDRLLTGYRRLEDIIRKRTGIKESGSKLFSQAFAIENSKLVWKNIEASEQSGRANLFTGMWMAYRNPRAHRESRNYSEQHLSEFLLLNHLFVLEAQAQKRRSRAKSKRSG
jgi:uncharacterized protein (TIGR02391 family)